MASRISELITFLRTCPRLSDLLSIAGVEEIGSRIIIPQGSSLAVQYDEKIDVTGAYECDIEPFASVYEDYQINCFQPFDPYDTTAPSANINILSYEQVQEICDWITQKDEARQLPQITGEKVVSIECVPFVPQVRYVSQTENIIAYFITLRIRYVNRRKPRFVRYE